MAIQCKVVLVGGVDVVDAYVRTKAVDGVKKDYEGSDGFYTTYSAEAFKDSGSTDGPSLQVQGGLTFKIVNLENYTGLTGAIVADAFGILYADLKAQIVARGWEAQVSDIENV